MSKHCRSIRTNKTDDFPENLTPLSTAVCPVGKALPSCHPGPQHINDGKSKNTPARQKERSAKKPGAHGRSPPPFPVHLGALKSLRKQEEFRLGRDASTRVTTRLSETADDEWGSVRGGGLKAGRYLFN